VVIQIACGALESPEDVLKKQNVIRFISQGKKPSSYEFTLRGHEQNSQQNGFLLHSEKQMPFWFFKTQFACPFYILIARLWRTMYKEGIVIKEDTVFHPEYSLQFFNNFRSIPLSNKQ